MSLDTASLNSNEISLADTILNNDAVENLARRARGEFPIVFRGTRLDRVEDSGPYCGTQGNTYFGYAPEQALSFAKVNGKNDAVIIRIDLQELASVDGINIELRDNDVVIRGKIPKEYIDVFPVG